MELIIAAVARRHAQIIKALDDYQFLLLKAHHPLEILEARKDFYAAASARDQLSGPRP
jgi:hypothetical protein